MAISINSSSRINGSTRIGPLTTIPPTVEYLVVAGGGGGGMATGRRVTAAGGAGGSGVVIVRYPNTYRAATVTGNPTMTVTGGYVVYTFTGSGTITWN